jgi:hypothetical protein
MKTTPLLLFPAICLGLAGCGKKPAAAVESQPPAVALDSFFTPAAATAAGSIRTLRATAKPGDPVVVSGRIMGREKPFVEGRAAFVLGDPAVLTPCNEKPGDECTTPWDTCCNSNEDKQAGTATIQLVGADGRVIKQGLKGLHGLTELSTVTVTGTVDKASSAEALIINASKLHVQATP